MLGTVLGAVLIALAYGAAIVGGGARPLAPWLMIAGLALLFGSLILVGVRRPGRPYPRLLFGGVGFLALVLGGGFAAALALPPETAGSPLFFGLPRRAALLVYGIGLLPVFVLPLLYALSFERGVLSPADLAELRARLAALAAEREGK